LKFTDEPGSRYAQPGWRTVVAAVKGIAGRGVKRMTTKVRAVTVHQVPEQGTKTGERSFLHDLQKCGEMERPRLVLDCSQVRHMDQATIFLLLACLEEVMKRDGDVKLASLHPGAEETLRVAGVNRLFEMYATTAEAVHSFQRSPARVVA
jgi:anti-anti-sigma factor